MPTKEELIAYARNVAAVKSNINPDYFQNQIEDESGFNPDAHNAASGADGIAQIVVASHPTMYGKTRDPYISLDYAAQLVANNLAYYGSYSKALIAYNWGPGNMQRNWDGTFRDLPTETQHYLKNILPQSVINTDFGVPMPASLSLSDVLAAARSRVGDPYVWGGKVPPSTDCSGFVSWCYNGKVPSFTDAIFDATERVAVPAPGDIVLYQYADPDQPGVKFPHVALYLDDATVLDNRYGRGVGVHPQLARATATRYYRRAPGVTVDAPAPVTTPVPTPAPAPKSDPLVGALTMVGEAYNYDGTVRKALASLRAQIVALETFLETNATKKAPV